MIEGGWHKQFEQTWGQIITGIIEEYLPGWNGWVALDFFKSNIDNYYRENNTSMNYRPSMQKINHGIKEWCNHHKIEVLLSHMRTVNGISGRWNFLGKDGETPF